MKIYLFFFTVLIILTSCEKEKFDKTDLSLSEYSYLTMDYPSFLNANKNSKVKIIYNYDGTISQRIGGLISSSPSSGYSYQAFDKIKDELEYSNNKITITLKLLPNSGFETCSPYKRVLFFNKKNRLFKRIDDNLSTEPYDNDTTLYYYTEKGQVDKIIRNSNIQQFTFNSRGNLSMITAIDTYTNYKDTIIYSAYDNTPNLTKKLFIFKECLIRSLSTNNYSKYSKKTYNSNNEIISHEDKQWTLIYDSDHNLIY